MPKQVSDQLQLSAQQIAIYKEKIADKTHEKEEKLSKIAQIKLKQKHVQLQTLRIRKDQQNLDTLTVQANKKREWAV